MVYYAPDLRLFIQVVPAHALVFTIVNLRGFSFYFLLEIKNWIIKKDKNVDRTMPLNAQTTSSLACQRSHLFPFAGACTGEGGVASAHGGGELSSQHMGE
jgi:hypothetical protein